MACSVTYCSEEKKSIINSLRKTFKTVFIISIIYEIYCIYKHYMFFVNNNYKINIIDILPFSTGCLGEALLTAAVFTIFLYIKLRNKKLRNKSCDRCASRLHVHPFFKFFIVVFLLLCTYKLYNSEYYHLFQFDFIGQRFVRIEIGKAAFITWLAMIAFYTLVYKLPNLCYRFYTLICNPIIRNSRPDIPQLYMFY